LRGLSALADAVIVATAADHPVITKDMLNLSGRRQPLLAMDLGMPRQIDPALAQNSGIVLGQLEHLLEMEPAAADPKMLATLRRELSRMSDSFRQFCCERRLARLFASL
jgi:glutamyl-tRNA reductase